MLCSVQLEISSFGIGFLNLFILFWVCNPGFKAPNALQEIYCTGLRKERNGKIRVGQRFSS